MKIRERVEALVQPSHRKLTLFACSCVREVWHLLKDERSKNAVIAAESYTDGLISKEEMQKAAASAASAASYASYAYYAYASDATWAAYYAFAVGYTAASSAAYASCNKGQALAKQQLLFDDIFGE